MQLHPPTLESDRSRPLSGDSAGACPDCGGRLAGGTCPACALGFLLNGEDFLHPVPGSRRVEENVEFGRYTLKEKLAAGGMGIVYVAEDGKLKRTVALKMIRGSTFADEAEIARFTLEAEAAAGLDHPNIVPVYEVGRLDGQPFFTMKLIEGQTLAWRLKEHNGTLPPREVATLLSKTARAVHHAHQRGVLHRDLKPGNILVDADGNPWLTDFGLAKLAHAESGLTLTKDHIGTPHYMAPETAAGNARQVSTASDVWALGVMLWEMLCGMPPFHGPGPVEIMRRIVSEEPSWPPGTKADGDLVTIARRCMEKNPARRPQSAGEVADELDRWLRGEPIKARRVTQQERFVKWARREPAMAALYAVMLIALCTGVFLWRRAEHAVVSLTTTNERMEVSLRTATATKLAGDARLQVQEDPGRALLLAVESVRMTEATGVLPEAASALMNVLTKAGGWDASQGALATTRSEVMANFGEFHRRAAQISPDGRWLLSLNTLRWGEAPTPAAIYDMQDSQDCQPLRQWAIWDSCPNIEVPVACWLPDSRRLLTVDGQGRIRIQQVITADMEAGLQEAAPPAMEDIATLPLRNDLSFYGVKLRAGSERMDVMWFEHPREGSPRMVRVAKALISRAGLSELTEYTLSTEGAHRVALAPSPSEQQGLVYGGHGDIIPFLLDLSGPAPVQRPLATTSRQVENVVFAASGRRVALQLADQTIHVADIPPPGSPVTEIPLRRVLKYPGLTRRMALSPDAAWLAVVGTTDQMFIVPLEEKEPQPVLQYFREGNGLAVNFSPDGQWLAAGGKDRTVYLWRMATIRGGTPPVLLYGLPSLVAEITMSNDNRSVAAVAFGAVVRRWKFDGISGATMPRHLAAESGIMKSAVSPDGGWVAAACDTASDGWSPDVSLSTGKGALLLTKLNGHSHLVLDRFAAGATGVAFSRDGRWLAGAGRDATVKVWDFAEAVRCAGGGRAAPAPRHVIRLPDIRTAFRWALAFHPDGRLYMVNGDGVLFCWDLNAADPPATQKSKVIHSIRYLLPDVAVSPDGGFLAAGRHGWDHSRPGSDQFGSQVLLFDVSSRDQWPPKPVAVLQADFLEYTNLAFSPDNRWLASGGTGYEPSLWDLRAPDIKASLRRPPVKAHLMSGVSFSPDGRWLALGAADGQIHFWNWLNGELRSVETASGVTCTTWMPDGRFVASGPADYLTVWDTDLKRLQSLALKVAGRELNGAERERFRVP